MKEEILKTLHKIYKPDLEVTVDSLDFGVYTVKTNIPGVELTFKYNYHLRYEDIINDIVTLLDEKILERFKN